MIRFRRLTPKLLNNWLVDQQVPTPHPRYRLRMWRENRARLATIQDELIAYIDEALEDARRKLRRGFEDDLSPFSDPATDPAANYPALLHRVTLQGYFGETLAGMAVEHWGAHNHTDWVVPAFLFRYHYQEFQHLDEINERLREGNPRDPDQDAEKRPGRTGDDCLAFRINEEQTITDVLTLEAKCLTRSNNDIIKEAHEKLVAGKLRPSGIHELISLLDEYDSPEAHVWQVALLKLWQSGYRGAARHDSVTYACGCIPKQKGRVAWMPTDAPHPAYTATRNLEGMEFQFEDLNTLVDMLYRGA
ncbi:hypothetical protein [Methylocaldum sp. 14B]|uniref:hypothetical protein n=1 Tax=Methylocaldum sp. 14B TaxID=1912213 RepID=UPI00098B7153|nr:hypothetical protein [Methylocaldum sp. 14B]